MSQTEGFMLREGRRTWYSVTGDPHGPTPPLVICHGGPGFASDYLTSVTELASAGRPCVRYDQFGCGRSDRAPERDADYWSVELFRRELLDLVAHLGIADGYHVLGHSWGGMLALELAAGRPAGLRSIIVADAFASSATYRRQVAELLDALPAETRAAIQRHEAAGSTESDEYQQAIRVFYGRHVCRARPIPEELLRTVAELGADSTVYQAMSGPSEFTMTGSLRDWDITDRLGGIEVPTLLISGRHDEVTPVAVEELHRGLPDASWVLFENSSHMPHLEEPARFRDVVAEFLTKTEL